MGSGASKSKYKPPDEEKKDQAGGGSLLTLDRHYTQTAHTYTHILKRAHKRMRAHTTPFPADPNASGADKNSGNLEVEQAPEEDDDEIAEVQVPERVEVEMSDGVLMFCGDG